VQCTKPEITTSAVHNFGSSAEIMPLLILDFIIASIKKTLLMKSRRSPLHQISRKLMDAREVDGKSA
jgi:hypothetical protein